jgi:hypothetical protein
VSALVAAGVLLAGFSTASAARAASRPAAAA